MVRGSGPSSSTSAGSNQGQGNDISGADSLALTAAMPPARVEIGQPVKVQPLTLNG